MDNEFKQKEMSDNLEDKMIETKENERLESNDQKKYNNCHYVKFFVHEDGTLKTGSNMG